MHKGPRTVSGILPAPSPVPKFSRPLSEREQQVLELFAEGESSHKGVAARLGVTVSTVSNVKSKLYLKLDAHNMIEALLAGIARGLVTLKTVNGDGDGASK